MTGASRSTPADPLDAAVVAAVNAHQRTDKGFGPALGPQAAGYAIARFQALGYAVVHGAVRLDASGRDDRDIQTEMLTAGRRPRARWTPCRQPISTAWLTRRRDAVAAGRSSIRVGHVDFFATPTRTR